MSMFFSLPLRGVIPPLVTPLQDADTLDQPGLANLVEHVLSGGVSGLFLLGSTGEGPSLSKPLQYEFITEAMMLINHRLPVLVGISDTSFSESLKLAEHAADAGADAVVLAPPYYFPSGQPELLEYLEHLAPHLPLPLFLYNMPSMTKVNIEVDTLRRASDIKNIVGFKDSSSNMIKFHEYLTAMRDRPDFSLLMGSEELMAEAVLFGGHGGVAGGANICPRLFVDLYNAAKKHDVDQITRLQECLFVLRRLYSCGRYSSTFIKGVKCALNLKGICSDCMEQPFRAFLEPEREQVRELLANFEKKYPEFA
ncbi:MAG: dihydrodipicolinate synthase family protein [Lentisphaeria bacterium]